MKQKVQKTILLIDYENVQSVDLSIFQGKEIEIKIFVGQSQNKIPLDLVQATQRFGNAVEWVKIEGTGNNSLDFHIAFYLGKLVEDSANRAFFILTKDKGFDPLIRYIKKQKISCQRIESLFELSTEEKTLASQDAKPMMKVVENLAKIDRNKRPRNRETLRQHIKTLFQNKLNDQKIDTLVNVLLVQNKISEASNRITYNF